MDYDRLRSIWLVYVFEMDDINFFNMNTIAMNLTNVEELSFGVAKSDEILLWLCHAAKLRKLMVPSLKNGKDDLNSGGLFGLVKWNKRRNKLEGASRVTIYTNEKVTRYYFRENYSLLVILIQVIQYACIKAFNTLIQTFI